VALEFAIFAWYVQVARREVWPNGAQAGISGYWIETMGDTATEREDRLRQLASKLFFNLEHKGSRYELYRDADVERPVRHEGLTLDEVEKILNLWKLRGPHGG